MNSSGKKGVLFMLDRVHTIKNGNLLQDYRFLFIGYYYYSAWENTKSIVLSL